MFNVKAGRIKPAVAKELMEALADALTYHDQRAVNNKATAK
jgi:hypothetical protein